MLNPKQIKFVDKYVHEQHPGKAAISAGYAEGYGKVLLANAAVKEEIDNRMAIVNTEKAKLTAKIHILGRDLLDEELVKIVRSEVSQTKLNAILVGYRRIGMLAGEDFVPDQDAEKQTDHPRIYRATQTDIIAHRIETKTQTVTREIVSNQPPPLLEAEPDPPYSY